MKNKIDSKIQNGYKLETGSLIDESIATFKKTFLISGLAMILLTIIVVTLYGALFGLIYGFSSFTQTITNIQLNQTSPEIIIGTVILTTLASALFAPITAGFIHSNHLAKNNKQVDISVFFDFYKNIYFKDIFLSYLLIGLTLGLINAALTLAHLDFLNIIFQIAASLLMVFVLPLIIYQNQNFEQALQKSIKLFAKQPLIIIAALIIAFIGVCAGILALCIGIIFTAPYYYAMVYAIYNQAIGFEEKSVIDEIGEKE